MGGHGSILLAPVGRERQLTPAAFIRFSHLTFHIFFISLFPFLLLTSPFIQFPSSSFSSLSQSSFQHRDAAVLGDCDQYLMCLLQPWHYCEIEETAECQVAKQQTIAASSFASGEELRESWVSIKCITTLIFQSWTCLCSWNPNLFLHCIHLNVLWFPQVAYQSNVNTFPLTSKIFLCYFDPNTSHSCVCMYTRMHNLQSYSTFNRYSTLLLVSSLPVAVVPGYNLKISDWRIGRIMADMTRQVTGDALTPKPDVGDDRTSWMATHSHIFFLHDMTYAQILIFVYVVDHISHTYTIHICREPLSFIVPVSDAHIQK